MMFSRNTRRIGALVSKATLAILLLLFATFTLKTSGATGSPIFWTGPTNTWTKTAATPSDTILPGKVVLTRGNRDVLYNTILEGSPGLDSPKGVLWAFGNSVTATNFSSCTGLTFQTLASLRNGNLGARILNVPMFMWLTNDNIFASVKFTVWGEHSIPVGGVTGAVSYARSSANLPTVSISSPSSGSVFAEPANVTMAANANFSGGTVTNVSFFAGLTLVGRATTPPFTIIASNLAANSYSLAAIVTAGGISATSSIVPITVVTPVDVALTSPAISSGHFSFNYSANAGLKYVIQRASTISGSGVVDWAPIVTNTAASASVHYSENTTNNPLRLFRVGRMPNP